MSHVVMTAQHPGHKGIGAERVHERDATCEQVSPACVADPGTAYPAGWWDATNEAGDVSSVPTGGDTPDTAA